MTTKSPTRFILRACVASASLAAASLLSGCAADGPAHSDAAASVPGSGRNDRTSGSTAASGIAAENIRDRLTNTDHGIEIRRWTILDGDDRVMAALTQHADGAAADPGAIERLKRNGLRFVRVPESHVDAIVAELGGATTDRNEWHGQVYEWRSLRETLIDGRGLAVAIDGRVRRFDRGDFRLLMRGWTVMMEDGPFMHVELLPLHRLPQANDLRRLLGEQPQDAGEAFASLALDLQLQSGYAYVLASESPAIDWPQLDTPARHGAARLDDGASVQPAQRETPAPQPPMAKARSSRFGPDDAFGPEAGAPHTLGELLLPTSFAPPTREILVFVPKIPSELFPPVYESDLAAWRESEDQKSREQRQ